MKLLVDHGDYGNFGDTAMVEAVCLRLGHLFPAAEISVVEHRLMKTAIWRYPNVQRQTEYTIKSALQDICRGKRFFWRFDPHVRRLSQNMTLRLLRHVRAVNTLKLQYVTQPGYTQHLSAFCDQFDGLHIAGGGNLTDTFFGELFKRCCLIAGFVEQGKPVVLTGQQIGPFRFSTSRKHLLRMLAHASFVGLREPIDSRDLCHDAGIRHYKVMGDDSFGLSAAPDADCRAVLAKHGLMPGRFLAVNVRMAPYAPEVRQHLRLIADIATQVASAQKIPIVIVPVTLGDNSDIQSGKELLDAGYPSDMVLLDDHDLNASMVKTILGNAFGAIGVSYHFCTFALAQGVPAVCLHAGDYYGQKGRGLCGFWKDNRLALSLPDINAHFAVHHILRLFNDDGMREKLQIMAKEAAEWWQNIFDYEVSNAFLHHPMTRKNPRKVQAHGDVRRVEIGPNKADIAHE